MRTEIHNTQGEKKVSNLQALGKQKIMVVTRMGKQ